MANANPEGQLVVGIQFDAQAFNDAWKYYTGHGGYFVSNNIYSRLVVLDVFERGDIQRDLADSWETPDNGRTWVFHLNPVARWHDGVPVTAHDVAYTYTTVLEHGYSGITFLQDVEAARAIDDLTVEIRLTSPNAAFLAQLGQFVLTHIVPKHLYEGTDWNTNPHNLNPIGSGPFKFVEWVQGERIELVANTEYWREGPYVAGITYRVIPEVADAIAAVEAGEVHFVTRDVPCSRIEDVQAMPGADVIVLPGHSMGFVAFNWSKPEFQDRRVREAIARAIDRQPIAASICPVATTPVHHYLEAVDWAFNAEAIAPEYDPAEAERLLDEAGFTAGDDDVRLRVRIGYRLIYPHYGVSARMIGEQLARIGIDATIEGADPVMWKEKYQDAGDFDLLIEAGDIGPDPQIMASYLASDGPRNVMRYSNPVVDEAFREGRATVNLDERATHYRRLQAALADDIARVPFLQHGEHLPYRPEFTGWSWSDGVRGTVPFWYHGKVRRTTPA
ncbi:MAG TPA: ABC transporter substrate-binding protein [Thermomicrobiales bacterium]|nr:ABC transporter substrate-binding protein [Thermomicrobiales bacterium]